GTQAGTDIHSYAATIEQTTPDPSSTYRLIQRDSNNSVVAGPNGDRGVPVRFADSAHFADPLPLTSGSVYIAFPPDGAATTLELWYGEPPNGTLLYRRSIGAAPVITNRSGGSRITNLH